MSVGRGAVTGALFALVLASPGARADAPPAPAEGGSVVVQMADGSSVPLQDWTFSYEYVAWKKGSSLAQAQPTRRDSRELWLGKRATPVTDAVVEVQYQDEERIHDDRGVATKEKVAIARGVQVKPASGSPADFKLEPPVRELLLGGSADKGLLVVARSLDLKGRTLAGTTREFCLLSFSAMIECGANAEDRVVKLTFTPATAGGSE
jgi:hypothetical protein